MEFVQISFINLATTKVFLRGFAWQDKIKKVQCHRNVSKECSNLFYVDCVDYCSLVLPQIVHLLLIVGRFSKKTLAKKFFFSHGCLLHSFAIDAFWLAIIQRPTQYGCDFRQFVFQATVGTLWSIQNQFDFVAGVASIPGVDQNKKRLTLHLHLKLIGPK